MSTTYTPRGDSLPARVIAFFTQNPDEVLDLDALEAKFDKPRSQWHTILGQAVSAGLLKRETREDDEELVYSLGNGAPPASRLRPPVDALWAGAEVGLKRKSPTKTERFDYSTLDIDNVVIKTGVPLPCKGPLHKMDVSPLLKRMKVKDSVVLPLKTRSVFQAAIKTSKAAGRGEFSIRKLNAHELGLWRVK